MWPECHVCVLVPEGIRDTMLQISGLLELQMGGEPILLPSLEYLEACGT